MNRTRLFTFVLLLSGLSGISYEILYGRMLGGMLGDQFAVSSAVLITFLLGIGLGSKYAHRFWKHLWLIEASIGLYGIAFALSSGAVNRLLYAGLAFMPDLEGSIVVGVLLLLFPAFLIGCSVPLFAGYLGRMKAGPVFSRVYSIYNMGAAATALLIEFWLIRKFGIEGTVLAFGTINLLAGALLFAIAAPIATMPPARSTNLILLPRRQILSLILASIASAVFQLFMVKISELMFGPFRESFALVLAIILFGIAAGSFLVKRFGIGYGSLLLGNVVGLFLFMALYKDLLVFYSALYEIAVTHGVDILILKGTVLLLLMGIPATTFGATIPALLKTQSEVAQESGSLLFVASLANVAGFLLMALFLHQYLDYGVQLLVISALTAAALAVYAWGKYPLPLAAAAVTLLTIGLHQWKWDENMLYLSYTAFHSEQGMEKERKEFNFPDKFKGHQDVFAINWIKGDPYFFINGYISIPMNNPSEKIVGTIGPMFSPKTGEALVLGLGSGATASAVGQLFGHTDVVEINPVVRENLFRMKRWNFDIEHNPRVNIIVDDAIHYTRTTTRRYDMILNTVTTPLYFSSSKLYTRDFFGMVKSRLNPDGIYVTWMDGRIGSRGAEIILNTLKQSFSHCALVFIKSGYFLLIASDNPVRLQHPDIADTALPLKMDLMGKHSRIPRLFAYNLMTPKAFDLVKNSNAPINTLDRPELEFEMARLGKEDFVRFRNELVAALNFDDVQHAIEPVMKYDPVQHVAVVETELGSSAITTRWKQQANIYVRNADARVDAAKLEMYRTIAEVVNDAETHQNLGLQYQHRHRYQEAIAEYVKVLQLDPNHKDTLYHMGYCQEMFGQYAAAIDSLGRSGRENSTDPDVPYRLAGIYFIIGDRESALKEINRAMAMKQDGRTFFQRGSILDAMGRTDAAVADYRQALALMPDNPAVQFALGQHLAKW